MKLKTKPTERIDRRYLLILAENKDYIEQEILYFLGAIGTAKVNPVFIENPKLKSNEFLIAINRKELENVRASFELSKKEIKIKKVSGTLRGLGF